MLLEKLIEDYWSQNQNFITALLTKDSKTGIDPLKELINQNCESLINRILNYLSKIPIEYSFQRMQEKMHEVAEHSRFVDYVNSWSQ